MFGIYSLDLRMIINQLKLNKMKNNTKEVQQLKQQILDLTDQVEALQMLIYFHEMEDETKKLEQSK